VANTDLIADAHERSTWGCGKPAGGPHAVYRCCTKTRTPCTQRRL